MGRPLKATPSPSRDIRTNPSPNDSKVGTTDRFLVPHAPLCTEMNLLAAIAAQGSVQPARLGRAMALEKSTLSRNSSRLVDRGWVEIRDHQDGPGVLLALTERGNEMLLQALPAWQEAQQRAQSLVAETLPDLGARKEAS